jgi:hypothetical protein
MKPLRTLLLLAQYPCVATECTFSITSISCYELSLQKQYLISVVDMTYKELYWLPTYLVTREPHR